MTKEKKEKEVVVDEVWTETRVREFLDVKPAEAIEADFHMLQKAYQQMRADDFEKFVAMFLQEKHDINARDPHGRTLLSYMLEHKKSADYVDIMQRNGAV